MFATVGSVPLSPLARAAWLRCGLDDTYRLSTARAVRITGRLDPDRLAGCLTGLVLRHAALRLRYPSASGTPVAVPADPAADPMVDAVLDLEVPADQLSERLVADALAPMDPATGPVLRVRLYRTGPDVRVLLLAVHPVAADQRSMAVLVEDLLAGYAGVDAPVAAEPPAPLAVDEADLAYWREQLAGDRGVLDLAPSTGRPAARDVTGYRAGRQVSLELDRELTDRLAALATDRGVPPHAVLLAGVGLLLRRYTGTTQLSPGLPVTVAGTGDPIGPATTTLLPRLPLDPDRPVGEVIDRVAAALDGALAHRAVPLDALASLVASERGESGRSAALPYQVAVELDELLVPPGTTARAAAIAAGTGGAPSALAHLTVEPVALPGRPVDTELTVCLAVRRDTPRITLGYHPDVLPTALVDALSRDLLAVLAELPDGVDRPAAELLAEPTYERPRPVDLARSHRPGAGFEPFALADVEQSIPDRFAAIARRYPDRPAVLADDGQRGYAELAADAAALAGALLTAGPGEAAASGAGGRVGLLLDHGIAAVTGILGTLYAGRTYVPLDPSYPPDRLAYMLDHSGADVLLTTGPRRALADRLVAEAGREVTVLSVEELPTGSSGNGDTAAPAVPVPTSPDAPAYILYTSGSTGQPKGVVQNHRNVLFGVRNHTNNLRIGPGDRTSLLSSFSFDMAVTDLFAAILTGAAVVPVDIRTQGLDHLAEAMTSRGVTIYHSTPTVYRFLLDSLGGDGVPGGDPPDGVAQEGGAPDGDPAGDAALPTIRAIVLGGEEVTRRDVERCRARLGKDCVFVNGYGATEVSFAVQNHLAATDELDAELPGGVVPIGVPLPGMRIDLLDPAGRPACLTGEIAVRSRHLAMGYWADPARTADKFTEHGDDTRTYRTGDLGRRLPDGRIAYLGRLDRQVKIRGYRVELGEIEAALSAVSGVAQATAVTRDADPTGTREVVGYVVPVPGTELAAPALRQALEQRLPHYLVPATIVVLDAFPLTPTGKVDTRALPPPLRVATVGPAPRDGLAGTVAAVWCSVLGVDAVGADDSFFDVGGHSLLMAQVQHRLAERLGVRVSLAQLFAHPTVGTLTRYLEGVLRRGAVGAAGPAGTAGEPPVPSVVSHAAADRTQQRMARRRKSRERRP